MGVNLFQSDFQFSFLLKFYLMKVLFNNGSDSLSVWSMPHSRNIVGISRLFAFSEREAIIADS